MSEGVAFLTKRRPWRMGDVTWSVHHSVPPLDRPGIGTNKIFRYITHDELSRYVAFGLGKKQQVLVGRQTVEKGQVYPDGRKLLRAKCRLALNMGLIQGQAGLQEFGYTARFTGGVHFLDRVVEDRPMSVQRQRVSG